MSELDTRSAPSRGRTSTRGGRGAYSTRGGQRPTQKTSNGTTKDTVQFDDAPEDEGELGDMKKKYGSQLSMIKDIFPQWSDADLLLALAETDGDIETTVERVAAGNVSQFSEVQKKTKDRSRSKVAKDSPAVAGADQFSTPVRGSRGRGGFEGVRGGRGRGADRGRGGFRGARGGHATLDSTVKDTTTASIPTIESSAWDTTAPAADPSAPAWDQPAPAVAERAMNSEPINNQNAWGTAAATAVQPTPPVAATESTPAASSETQKASVVSEVVDGAKKTWASMFAKPKPAPVLPKTPSAQPPTAIEQVKTEESPVAQEPVPVEDEIQQQEPVFEAPTIEEPAAPAAIEQEPEVSTPESVEQPAEPEEIQDASSSLAPSQVPLTEDNLENLPDVSHPPATLTAASTAGSADPRGLTPLPGASQQAPIGRPPTGGFQASAYRAAATPGRTPSYQRRVLEQQEAVVMPGHNAVDRAAVQFGSLGLNGDADLDVDDEREEPETRTQPQQSPPSQPRASLPPAPRQAALSQEQSIPENLPTPKQAPGLPPPAQQNLGQQYDSSSLSSLPQDSSAYSQYSRYGQPETTTQAQKPFDPFSHQAPSSAFDQYSSQPSAQQHQQGFNAFSSAPTDYSQYYTADQQRNAYQNYYNTYGQQNSQGQDGSSLQQRSSSGFGSAPGDSAFSTTQAPQQSQARYNDAQGSGHNTPNPSMSQQTAAPSQQMHQQSQHQQTGYPGYPYGHPYYNSPYHAAYQNQFGFNGQVGYGAPFAGKGAMYGQPHGYGMNPPSSYESTPANAGGFGQSSMHSRDSALGSGLGDYGRSSAQPSQLSSSGFGGMSEPFGRAQSGFQGQSQGYGQQQSMQQSGTSDELKPFGESKASGPSPALGQPGRPGSATNSVGGQAAPSSALPPPQSHQQGFGGYPGFGNQGSQYGLGGLGGSGQQAQQAQQQQQQQGAYGGYSGFGNTYGNTYGRGGWGGNYGH